MIFQKRRSYPFVLFIPQEYFSFKNLKLNPKKWNYPAKNDFTVMIFKKPRSYPIVLVIPESFLTVILCPFWHEHPCSVSYQKDPALFDSFKIPHRVVVVVNDTVWASELPSLSTNKCRFTALTFQHNKINLRPRRKGRQLSISGLQMTILGLCISMLCCDDTLRSSFATWTSDGFVTVVARNGLKTIQCLVSCSPFLKNGSTVFKIHGRPQTFIFQWSKKKNKKKLSHNKHLLVS